jgi:dTDP-4-dehydrorhamnose reductase
MRILITGAGGMLADRLCPSLAQEHEVIGLDLRKNWDMACFVSFIEFDLSEADRTFRVVNEAAPDLVINLAAWTDVDGCETDRERSLKINYMVPAELARVTSDMGVPFIHISTDYVFSGENPGAYVENDQPDPLNFYGECKLKAEEAIKANPGRSVIIRTSALFGPGGSNFVRSVIEKARIEDVLDVVEDQITSPTYTADLSSAIKEVAERFERYSDGVYHFANEGECSWADLADKSLELADLGNVSVRRIPSTDLSRPANRPHRSVLDTGRFRAVSGMNIRHWEEALAEYIKGYFKERKNRADGR